MQRFTCSKYYNKYYFRNILIDMFTNPTDICTDHFPQVSHEDDQQPSRVSFALHSGRSGVSEGQGGGRCSHEWRLIRPHFLQELTPIKLLGSIIYLQPTIHYKRVIVFPLTFVIQQHNWWSGILKINEKNYFKRSFYSHKN